MQIAMLCGGPWLRAAVMVLVVLGYSARHAEPVKVSKIALGRHHRPVSIYQKKDQTATLTFNWSGYAVTGPTGSVTNVTSSWVVPTGDCAKVPDGYAAFWTGIDGWSDATVEQTGTDSDCVNLLGTQAGVPTYYAWFEFYPQVAYLIGDYTSEAVCLAGCVYPGDLMTAEVTYLGYNPPSPGPPRGQAFTLTITDLTQNWYFTTGASVPGALASSAEWIAETPFGCNTPSEFCPFSDFTKVKYGFDYTKAAGTSYATVGGKSGPIGSFGSSVQQAIMVAYTTCTEDCPPPTVMALPSSLSTDGTSFNVTWASGGP
jgi:Peptidase A4 family